VSCAYSNTDTASAGCAYNGGPLDNKQFKGAVDPGSGRKNQGLFSTFIEYPIGIVQYDATDGLAGVNATVGGFTQTFAPTLNFTLSSVKDEKGKPKACVLIEQRLKRIKATDFYDDFDDSNWVKKFLNVSVQPAVIDAIPRVLNGANPSDIYYNVEGARDKAALEIAKLVGDTLNAQLGDDFFCKPSYKYGQPAEQCGEINLILPQPTMDEASLAVIRAPQEAKTKADNEIAVAREASRKAAEVAAAKTEEAKSAAELATAEEQIATEQGRVETAKAQNLYAWCAELVELGQSCWLVKAAETGNLPAFITDTMGLSIPVPTTTVPG
jgi:hypothetical protein